MKIYTKDVKQKIYHLILALLIILPSGTALQTIFPKVASIIYLLALIEAFAFMIIIKRVHVWNIKSVATSVFVLMLMQTFLFSDTGNIFSYVRYGIMIMIAYTLSEQFSIEKVAKYFVSAMTIITIISLFGYFFANYTALTSFFPERANINGEVYKCGIVFNYIKRMPERNCGIFWEPGIFATYLIWALLADQFIVHEQQKKKITHILLFTMGIFTANSTAGFALWVVFIILLLIDKKKQSTNLTAARFLQLAIATIILAIAILSILNIDFILDITGLANNPFWSKLQTDKFASSSRMNAFAINIGYFLEHPFLGQGLSAANASAKYWSTTSTSTFFLNAFGWLGGTYTLFWCIGIFRQKRLNFYSKVVIALIVFSIINKEPHDTFPMSWLILYLLLSTPAKKSDQFKEVS